MTPPWIVWTLVMVWMTAIALTATFGGELWQTRTIGVLILPAGLLLSLIGTLLLIGTIR